MRQVSDRDVDAVAQAIEAYLESHPGAADNEHGIAAWWLPNLGLDVPAARVLQALQQLVTRGVVVAVTLPGGAIYRAAPPQVN